ncbi:DUF625-domain-containing protein [Calocera cornea HHB12733]|uniref:DUF625-domain-containing protein n=1 Tax=Calocera cornea HHB12733 TaxID=1353952 RepID=A0A165K701_9BASI|nr:DUF625-domain-containing protein [Calocera cornea HHB12733]
MSFYGEKPIPQTPISSPSNSPQRKDAELPAETDRGSEMPGNGSDSSARASTSAPPGTIAKQGEAEKANGLVHEDRREEDAEEEDMELDDEGNGPPDLARFMNGGPNRVKVYELIGSGWHDLGTGFVRTGYDQVNDRAELVVSGEEDGGEILRRPIHKEDVYQVTHGNSSNQREADDQPAANGSGPSQGPPTLITWTEPDGQDYALSFQDSEGCADVWDFILDVQTHMLSNRDETEASLSGGFSPPAAAPSSPFSTPSVPSSPERLPVPVSDVQVMLSNLIQRQELPVPQLGNINEIEQAFKLVGRSPGTKQKLCEAIVSRVRVCCPLPRTVCLNVVPQDFWKQCIEVHDQAEDLESLDDLHALCKLAQTLLLLNDVNMYDYIVKDDVFLGVLGMLEYDPDFPYLKAGYRDFMQNVSHFHEVIDLKDDVILRKIHNVYRLQFLMDVVLARVLDDPVFNVLKSCMLYQQVEIIQFFSTEEMVLRELFSYFDEVGQKPARAESADSAEAATVRDKRGDIILLLHQLCMMAKTVQVPLRVTLYRRLVDKGLVNALSWGLLSDNPQIRSATGELLTVVVDHDAAAVRNFILNQVGAPPSTATLGTAPTSTPKHPRRLTLVDTMQKLMLTPGIDTALKSQMADATKTLLEFPVEAPPGQPQAPPEVQLRAREDPTIERFLTWFYDGDTPRDFFMPLLRLPEFQLVKRDPPTSPPAPKLTKAQASHIFYLTDLLATFAAQHSHRSAYFIMSSVISTRIAMLLFVKEKHIRLAALRFFRSLVRLHPPNQFLIRHLMGKNLFFPLVDLAGKESHNDNLVSACYQEYFEWIKKENVRNVINEMMVSYGNRVREIAKDKTPMGRIFEGIILRWEQNKDSAAQQSQPVRPAGIASVARYGHGQSIESEEEDYFNGSDDEEEIGPMPAANGTKGQKRKTGPKGGTSGPTKSPARPASLVDYEDNEDEDMEKPGVEGSLSSSLEPSHELLAAAHGADSPTVRHILRPRPLYTNGVKPSKGPPSPSLPVPSIARRRSSGGSGSESPDSPRNGMRTPSPPPSRLGRKSPPPSPRASSLDSSSSPPRPGEKRKRDEEDEDDLLGTLDRSSKRRSLGPDLGPEGGMALPKTIPIPGTGKDGEGKKMKLKLGKGALSVAGSAAMSSAPPPVAAAAVVDTKDNG